jgi:hypothetical protein
MTRVLQRILRRRGPTSDEPALESPDHEQGAQDSAPVPEHGVDPGEAAVDAHPSFRSRGAMRRRLRYLRRARELGFRDLGGLVFDLRRFERDRPDLVEAKVHALFEVDGELRALERALDDRREVHELREPGIASCPRCGALHSSDARFCSSCGLALRGPQPVSEVGDGVPAQLAPPHPRPAALPAGGAPPTPPHTPPPPRPGQGHDEPAPFGNEPPPEDGDAPTSVDEPAATDGDETRDDATRVLPPEEPQDAADDADEQSERRRTDG